MVYSAYIKQRIVHLYYQGYKVPTTTEMLLEEGMAASVKGIAKFLEQYKEMGTICRRPVGHQNSL